MKSSYVTVIVMELSLCIAVLAEPPLWRSGIQSNSASHAATYIIGTGGLTTATNGRTIVTGYQTRTDGACDNAVVQATVTASPHYRFNENTTVYVDATSAYTILHTSGTTMSSIHFVQVNPVIIFASVLSDNGNTCFAVDCSSGNTCIGTDTSPTVSLQSSAD